MSNARAATHSHTSTRLLCDLFTHIYSDDPDVSLVTIVDNQHEAVKTVATRAASQADDFFLPFIRLTGAPDFVAPPG